MGEDGIMLTGGSYYINGEEIGPGIPDFECTTDDLRNELSDHIKFKLDSLGEFTATLKIHIDKIFCAKMMGLYQWVCENCPNRRVIHLMKYGKNKRVKNKNLQRALGITFEYVMEQEALKYDKT